MEFKKMGHDFLKVGGPVILGGIITGLTFISTNFKNYFNDDNKDA